MPGNTSSIVYKDVVKLKHDQLQAGTWTILIPVLIVSFIALKLFVYIKDDKRHGK